MFARISSLCAIALLVLFALTAGSSRPVSAAPAAGASAAVSYIPELEVRLRKVHVVRPDLIPYPIAYEVIC